MSWKGYNGLLLARKDGVRLTFHFFAHTHRLTHAAEPLLSRIVPLHHTVIKR